MNIDFVHSVWGLETLSSEQVFELATERGFAGVEMKIPENKGLRSELTSHLKSYPLQLVAQLSTHGEDADAHIRDLDRKLKHAPARC